MEIGIPQSILYPVHPTTWDLDTGQGCEELIFNSFTTTPTSLAFPNSNIHVLRHISHPAAGILVQQNLEDPAIRTAIDNRAHKSGGIMHTFYRGPRYTTLEALIIGDTPSDREAVAELLRGALQAIMDRDGRYFYKPSNAATRYLTVRHYEALKIAHSTSTTGSAVGVSAPKSALVTLVSPDWTAYTYGTTPITFGSSGTLTIPNNGNTDMWPRVRVYGSASFILTNNTTGEEVKFISPSGGFGIPAAGAFYEVDMLNEMIWWNGGDGSVADVLNGLDPTVTNFWRIPPGGASISTSSYGGLLGEDTVIYATDAWA